MNINEEIVKSRYSTVTRVIDVLISSFAIVITFPFTLFILVVLRLSGEKNPIYRQKRIGRGGTIFSILKFNSMSSEYADEKQVGYTLRNDPRITSIGKALRITKLNELPQLFNVLVGEMSIVGPRPLMLKGYDNFIQSVGKGTAEIIFSQVPGITGIGSIVFRDEERLLTDLDMDPEYINHTIVFPHKAELEIWYLENRSVAMYFVMILLTTIKLAFPNTKYERRLLVDLPSPPIHMYFSE